MFKRIVNVVEVLAVIAAAVFVLLLFTNEPDSGGERQRVRVTGRRVVREQLRTVSRQRRRRRPRSAAV